MKKEIKFTPERTNYLNLSLQRISNISKLFLHEFSKDQFSRNSNFAAYDLLDVTENSRKFMTSSPKNERDYLECLSEIFENSQIYLETENQNNILKSILTEYDLILMDEFTNLDTDLQRFFKEKKISIRTIAHNNTEILEGNIVENKSQYKRIWFLTNSIFPLLGSILHCEKLSELLSRYDQFFLFVKDCNSLGWYGSKGKGLVRSKFPEREKIIISAQLNKSFNASTEIIITPRVFRNLPSGEVSHHSIQSAIIAASSVYLSGYCPSLQAELQNKAEYFRRCLKNNNISFTGEDWTPYFFIPAKNAELGRKLTLSLIKEGFYAPFHCYPEVPINQCGISVNISLRHSVYNLKALSEAISWKINNNL